MRYSNKESGREILLPLLWTPCEKAHQNASLESPDSTFTDNLDTERLELIERSLLEAIRAVWKELYTQHTHRPLDDSLSLHWVVYPLSEGFLQTYILVAQANLFFCNT